MPRPTATMPRLVGTATYVDTAGGPVPLGDSAVIEECMIALWVSPAAVPSLFMPGRVLDLDCDRWVVGRARGYSRCAWPGT